MVIYSPQQLALSSGYVSTALFNRVLIWNVVVIVAAGIASVLYQLIGSLTGTDDLVGFVHATPFAPDRGVALVVAHRTLPRLWL